MSLKVFIICTLAVAAMAGFPRYTQCDGRWGGDRLGTHPTDTVCKAGCLVTSAAMMMAGHGIRINGEIATPKNLNQYLTRSGQYWQGDGFRWGSIEGFGYHYTGWTNAADAKNRMKSGQTCILNVNGGHHFVLATGHNAQGFSILDPGSGPRFDKTFYANGDVVGVGCFRR